MAHNASKGRQRVIEAAATMLASHGLRGISIREVTKFAGAPLGSTYHNFPAGKYQIVTEAVIWAGEQVSQQLKTCLENDKQNGVSVFLKQWCQRLKKSQFRAGCPIFAAAIEASPQAEGEAVNQAVSQVFQQWQSLIAEHLAENGHSMASAQASALMVIASIEGAVVLCRAHQSLAPLEAILGGLPKMLTANNPPN